MNDDRPARRIAGWHALSVLALMAAAPSAAESAEVLRESYRRPPPAPRPVLGGHVPTRPSPPREPSVAELLAAEKRKRKAARRLDLEGRGR